MSEPRVSGLPAKQQVARSFSRAAQTYDQVAGLQRHVLAQLLTRLPGLTNGCHAWVDLGCGTGYGARLLRQRYPQALGLALDLAPGMLQQARCLDSAQHYVVADAEQLPLADGCCDLVMSSLAVQWCDHFGQVLDEAYRVLRPGGVLLFSSLCQGTLHELSESWKRVDQAIHVNRFRRWQDYQALCAASDLEAQSLEQVEERLWFSDFRRLSHELKALGAHNLNSGRPTGLTSRKRLQRLLAAYETWRQPEGLPATYQVLYGVLSKA